MNGVLLLLGKMSLFFVPSPTTHPTNVRCHNCHSDLQVWSLFCLFVCITTYASTMMDGKKPNVLLWYFFCKIYMFCKKCSPFNLKIRRACVDFILPEKMFKQLKYYTSRFLKTASIFCSAPRLLPIVYKFKMSHIFQNWICVVTLD